MTSKKKKSLIKKIDLHGIRHHMVKSVLVRGIEDVWDTETPVEIITGHSPQMKKIVKEILDEYKLEYQEGDFINPGYIKTVI